MSSWNGKAQPGIVQPEVFMHAAIIGDILSGFCPPKKAGLRRIAGNYTLSYFKVERARMILCAGHGIANDRSPPRSTPDRDRAASQILGSRRCGGARSAGSRPSSSFRSAIGFDCKPEHNSIIPYQGAHRHNWIVANCDREGILAKRASLVAVRKVRHALYIILRSWGSKDCSG